MTGDEFYQEVVERENWPKNSLCDPPTDPRYAIHVLIEQLLGKNWHVVMPEHDDQIITAAVADILDKYPRGIRDRVQKINPGSVIFNLINLGFFAFLGLQTMGNFNVFNLFKVLFCGFMVLFGGLSIENSKKMRVFFRKLWKTFLLLTWIFIILS